MEDGWSVGKRIFIAMAAAYWSGYSWRGAEGAIFGALLGVVERLMSPLGTQDVSAHEMAV